MTLSNAEAMKMINAMKSGVSYEAMADQLMVGRDELAKEINRHIALVQTGGSSFKIVTGEYGSGKTFFLNYIRKIAVENNMVVAQLEIDRSFKFYNLEHLYYHIMHNLYIKGTNGEKTSFEDLFDRWLNKIQTLGDKDRSQEEIMRVVEKISKHNTTFGRAFLSYIKARISNDVESQHAIESWLTGEKNIPYKMKQKFEIIGNITKLNVLDFLRAFVKLTTLLGYKGCVILIDEFDLVIEDRKDLRDKSYYNLKSIIDSIGNNKMPGMMWVFCGTNRLLKNQEKGFPSSEALYQRIGQPVVDPRRNFVDFRQLVIHIKSITYDDYLPLAERIVEIYKTAFRIKLTISSEALMNWALLTMIKDGKSISTITSRSYVKKLIDILDIIGQNPNNHIFRTELISIKENGKLQFKTKLGTSVLKEKAN